MPEREVIRSPNIWRHPDLYELENRGVDPDGVIEAAIREVRDWAGASVLDVGCGSGFHLPRFAADRGSGHRGGAAPAAGRAARQRVAGLRPATGSAVEVRDGTAQALPVPDAVGRRGARALGVLLRPRL